MVIGRYIGTTALIFPEPRKRCRRREGLGGRVSCRGGGGGHTQTPEPYNQAAAAAAPTQP